jgi:uncharacterized protein (TIGR03067 family)
MPSKQSADLDKLQGSWHVTSLEIDGSEMPAAALPEATITIRGDAFTSRGMGFDYAGTIELSPEKEPKTFDLIFTAGPPEGMRNRGIYTLDDDTWTICIATRGDARPRRFATKPDSGLALETLKRGKPGRHPERSEGSAVSPAQQQILRFAQDDKLGAQDDTTPTEIEGEFPMVSAVIDGKPLAPDMVKWCKRITRGNVTQVLAGPQSMLDAEFTLDPSKAPGHIDYVNRSGKQKGKKQAGIYEISDGLLKICVAPPGGARPTDFSSKKGDGRSLTVWRHF